MTLRKPLKKKKQQPKIKNKLVLQLVKIIRMRKKVKKIKLKKIQAYHSHWAPYKKHSKYPSVHNIKPARKRRYNKPRYNQARHFKKRRRYAFHSFSRDRSSLIERKKIEKLIRKKKWCVQWSNFFTNTLYRKSKKNKLKGVKALTTFSDSFWGTGSKKWPFWNQLSEFVKITKKTYNRLWNACYRSKLPLNEIYVRWFYLRQRYFVPSRYIYLISARWTPYYMTVFYLSKFWKKGFKKYNFLWQKNITYSRAKFFINQQNTSEIRLVKSIRKRIKKQIQRNSFIFYNDPFPWKQPRKHKYRNRPHWQRRHHLRKSRKIKKKFKIKLKRKIKRIKFKIYRSLIFIKISKLWKRVIQNKMHKKYFILCLRKRLLNFFNKRTRLKEKKITQEKQYFRKYIYRYIHTKNIRFKEALGNTNNNNIINCLKIRQSHRFGTYDWVKKIFLFQWLRYSVWSAIDTKKRNLLARIFIPYKFRHTQKKPYKYYNISRWHNKAMHWLNPVIHNRKLFPYQLKYCITKEKRHPHRRKRLKIYKWLQYTINNQWVYGMRAKKNYRLKQILFGRIILPALDGLLQKQFMYIKKNAAHVKPLGLSNSRPTVFLGKFERRLDVLAYKLNFAPTIQWARSFVKAGLIYVSYWTIYRYTRNYKHILPNYEKFPLLYNWHNGICNKFLMQINNLKWRRLISFSGRCRFIMPLPVTLPAYRVMLKGLVHWSNQNIKTWFFPKHFRRFMPQYFIFNKARTVSYFWRNLTLNDIDRLKKTRIKKNTFNWLA